MKVMPVLTLTIFAVFICSHQSASHVPGGGAFAIVAGLIFVLVACTKLGWALYNDKSTAAIDREVLQSCSSGLRSRPKKKTLGKIKNGGKAHSGIRELHKGPDDSNSSGLWGLRHIWALSLALAALCTGVSQATMAASSWLVGRQYFFVDNVTERPSSTTTTTTKSNKNTLRRNKKGSRGDSSIREAHKGSGLSKPSGLWRIRRTCAICLCLAAYFTGTLWVTKATASWLIGVRDPFEVTNIVSATTPEHKSAGLSNESPHVNGGIWGFRHTRLLLLHLYKLDDSF